MQKFHFFNPNDRLHPKTNPPAETAPKEKAALLATTQRQTEPDGRVFAIWRLLLIRRGLSLGGVGQDHFVRTMSARGARRVALQARMRAIAVTAT